MDLIEDDNPAFNCEVDRGFDFEIKHETEKAWLIDDGLKDHWLPKSQVKLKHEYVSDGSRFGHFDIPEWLAEQKGLI